MSDPIKSSDSYAKGKRMAEEFKKLPRERQKQIIFHGYLKGFAISISVIIAVSILFVMTSDDPKEIAPTVAVTSQPASQIIAAKIQYPKRQQEFIDIVSKAQVDYKNAANDIAKGGILAERNNALCPPSVEHNFEYKKITDWIGKVISLKAMNDGAGLLKIEIFDNIHLESPESTSGILYPGTPVYIEAAKLKEGDLISFSGNFFFAGGDIVMNSMRGTLAASVPCLALTNSHSLNSNLRNPRFAFNFKSLKPYKP
jgi:hypothetical protein